MLVHGNIIPCKTMSFSCLEISDFMHEKFVFIHEMFMPHFVNVYLPRASSSNYVDRVA